MPISSGRCRIKKMTKVSEYFEVGETFEYSPLTEPDTCVLVKVVETEEYDLGCDSCDLRQWCDSETNQVEMEDGSMQSFTPNCWMHLRSDKNDVYFKKI
jgi:hypothetical protein